MAEYSYLAIISFGKIVVLLKNIYPCPSHMPSPAYVMLYTRSPQSIEEGAQAEIPGEDEGGARGTVRRRELVISTFREMIQVC